MIESKLKRIYDNKIFDLPEFDENEFNEGAYSGEFPTIINIDTDKLRYFEPEDAAEADSCIHLFKRAAFVDRKGPPNGWLELFKHKKKSTSYRLIRFDDTELWGMIPNQFYHDIVDKLMVDDRPLVTHVHYVFDDREYLLDNNENTVSPSCLMEEMEEHREKIRPDHYLIANIQIVALEHETMQDWNDPIFGGTNISFVNSFVAECFVGDLELTMTRNYDEERDYLGIFVPVEVLGTGQLDELLKSV